MQCKNKIYPLKVLFRLTHLASVRTRKLVFSLIELELIESTESNCLIRQLTRNQAPSGMIPKHQRYLIMHVIYLVFILYIISDTKTEKNFKVSLNNFNLKFYVSKQNFFEIQKFFPNLFFKVKNNEIKLFLNHQRSKILTLKFLKITLKKTTCPRLTTLNKKQTKQCFVCFCFYFS